MNHALWFVDNSIGVFPIKDRSKEPACRSWDDFDCTHETVLHFKNYGVRLSTWLGVIDTDEPAAEEFICQQIAAGVFKETPFQVKGARGLHRYYRLNAEHTPKFIKREGLTIEFRNAGQYVVGPGSTHPTGVVYESSDWSWNLQDVPIFPADFVFDTTSTGRAVEGTGLAYEFPTEVLAGERHDALYKLLRSLKALQNPKEVVWEIVLLANENRCSPPVKINSTFKQWFNRGFDAADRPIERVLPKKIDDLGMGGI